MKKTIQIKNADQIFKSKTSRLSPHDFTNIVSQNKDLLSGLEQEALLKLAEMSPLEGDSDILVKKEKGKIKLTSF